MKGKYLFTVIVILFLSAAAVHLSFGKITNYAKALSGYSRAAGESDLRVGDWNKLSTDFLATDGTDSLASDLDMQSSHNIVNVASNPADGTSAANAQFVQSSISGGAGGSVYTSWGSSNCGTDTVLYRGYAFGAYYLFSGGMSNYICVQDPVVNGPGTQVSGSYSTYAALTTVNGQYNVPSGILDPNTNTIAVKKIVHCSVCFRQSKSCYLNYGSWNCSRGAYTNRAYDGYLMGDSPSTPSNGNRVCVNRDFDSSSNVNSLGAPFYGSVFKNASNPGAGYQANKFVRCALCCN